MLFLTLRFLNSACWNLACATRSVTIQWGDSIGTKQKERKKGAPPLFRALFRVTLPVLSRRCFLTERQASWNQIGCPVWLVNVTRLVLC